MVIQLFKGTGRQPWYLRVVSGNGQTLLTSEGYFSRSNARRAARKWDAPFVDLTVPRPERDDDYA